MDKSHAVRTYSLFIATGIKFIKTTPDCVIDQIVEYVNGDFPPPVGIQPYKESVHLYENLKILSSHMQGIADQNPELLKEILETFSEMSEEEFIQWYRESRKK